MPDRTIFKAEDDGDRIEIVSPSCLCGQCGHLIYLTPEGEETKATEFYTHVEDYNPQGAAIGFLLDALGKEKARIGELEKELKKQASRLLHIGYSNMHQIRYVIHEGEESGSFFPDAENQSDIPIYMLRTHINRLGHDFDISKGTLIK